MASKFFPVMRRIAGELARKPTRRCLIGRFADWDWPVMSRDVGSGDGGTVVSQRHGQVNNVPKQLAPPQVKARSSEIHRPSTRSLSGTG
jgi:hypothetical protein